METVDMQTIYFNTTLIAMGITVVYTLLLSDLDFDIFGVDTTNLLMFTIIGGLSGYLLEKNTEMASLLILVISILISFSLTVIVSVFLINPLKRSETTSATSIEEIVGKKAVVLTPIPKNGYGEVLVKSGNNRRSLGAEIYDKENFKGTRLETDEEVIIKDIEDYIAKVEEVTKTE